MKPNQTFKIAAFAFLATIAGSRQQTYAKVVLPSFFTSNMVLQQKASLTLSGTGDPNTTITLRTGWSKQEFTTQTDHKGTWKLSIKTPKAGGPYSISIADNEETRLDNIMIGEVWFCSGQSNMEMPVAGWGKVKNYEQEIQNANHPDIRFFQVKKATSLHPLQNVTPNMGGWVECSPSTVPEFSSLAYFYARELQNKLNVPVGVIDCTWGGTPAEAWTSMEALAQVMGFEATARQMIASNGNDNIMLNSYNQEIEKWKNKVYETDNGYTNGIPAWTGDSLNDSNWSTMSLPSYWESNVLPNFDGIVWFRKTINVPANWNGKELELSLGIIDDEDIVFWNGKQIAQGSGYNQPRHYRVPAELVKQGNNILTIRVFDTGGEGGIAGNPDQLYLKNGNSSLPIDGMWKYRIGCSIKKLPPSPANPMSSSYPSVLFNAMVNPWAGFPVKGVIWYQGEANVGRATQYESLFQTLIADWRHHFQNADMPFYFVQLANYLQRKEVQSDSPWAALREAQAKALNMANTGMVVNIDLGEANDIHPKNKQEVARRLAAVALADTYGKKVESQAPTFNHYEVKGQNVELYFDQQSSKNTLRPNTDLKGFIVAGPDHVFYPAKAWTDGKTVTVTCEKVAYPIAVRYGWADNPECTLYSNGGLPVAPFRTDNW